MAMPNLSRIFCLFVISATGASAQLQSGSGEQL